MNLILDFGNTRTKAHLFEGDAQVRFTVLEQENPVEALLKLLGNQIPERAIWVNSGLMNDAVLSLLEKIGVPTWKFGTDWPLPFINHYQTPKTLGADRLAGVCGAFSETGAASALVISLGTCITWDLLTAGGYQGGGIGPGLKMRLYALHKNTENLPLIGDILFWETPGKTTNQSIQHGTVWAMSLEIDAIINTYKSRYPNIQIFLTGGDLDYFAGSLKNDIFARPNILASGLNFMLKHYAT